MLHNIECCKCQTQSGYKLICWGDSLHVVVSLMAEVIVFQARFASTGFTGTTMASCQHKDAKAAAEFALHSSALRSSIRAAQTSIASINNTGTTYSSIPTIPRPVFSMPVLVPVPVVPESPISSHNTDGTLDIGSSMPKEEKKTQVRSILDLSFIFHSHPINKREPRSLKILLNYYLQSPLPFLPIRWTH